MPACLVRRVVQEDFALSMFHPCENTLPFAEKDLLCFEKLLAPGQAGELWKVPTHIDECVQAMGGVRGCCMPVSTAHLLFPV